jgi:hypothetical protein
MLFGRRNDAWELIGGIMEFKISDVEALEMADFEEAVGCDVSAEPDWGIHFDKVIEFVLDNTKADDMTPDKELSNVDSK